MRQPNSQVTCIRKYLEAGKRLTPIEALNKFDCFRLASRVEELRGDGIPVRTEMVAERGKRFARYSL